MTQTVPSPLVLTDVLRLAEQSDRLDWQPFRAGVEIYPLYSDNGASAALLKYEPGASVPEHRHTGYEHIMVLSGSQRDRNGVYSTGTIVINPPESQHKVYSDDGCIIFIVWQHPVHILDSNPDPS